MVHRFLPSVNGGPVNTGRKYRKRDMLWSKDNEFNFRCAEFEVKKTSYGKKK